MMFSLEGKKYIRGIPIDLERLAASNSSIPIPYRFITIYAYYALIIVCACAVRIAPVRNCRREFLRLKKRNEIYRI